jgi:hypothetical protein
MTLPRFLRAACIRRLADVTAAAFGCAPARISDLDSFASFTTSQAEAALRSGQDTAGIERGLFLGARRVGNRLRFWLRVRSMRRAMSVARALYRLIDIEFHGESCGSFEVSRCRFSSCYSPAVCGLIGSLDRGLLAGLTGGARMTFTRRITEGASSCAGAVR